MCNPLVVLMSMITHFLYNWILSSATDIKVTHWQIGQAWKPIESNNTVYVNWMSNFIKGAQIWYRNIRHHLCACSVCIWSFCSVYFVFLWDKCKKGSCKIAFNQKGPWKLVEQEVLEYCIFFPYTEWVTLNAKTKWWFRK